MTDQQRQLDDAQALALALEHLRRAADALLTALTLGEGLDTPLHVLEGAVYVAKQEIPELHRWAAEVLDGTFSKPPKRKNKKKRIDNRPQTLDAVINQAKRSNLVVHLVRSFEGTEYAIYRGSVKVAHAKSETRCIAVLRRLMF